jgi:hypothetical protein
MKMGVRARFCACVSGYLRAGLEAELACGPSTDTTLPFQSSVCPDRIIVHPCSGKNSGSGTRPTLCRSSLRGIRGCTVCCSMRMRWVWPGSIRPQVVPGRRARQATAYASIPDGWLPTQGWKASNLVRICTAMLLRPLTISLCQVLHLTRHISCGQHHHAHSIVKVRVHKP